MRIWQEGLHLAPRDTASECGAGFWQEIPPVGAFWLLPPPSYPHFCVALHILTIRGCVLQDADVASVLPPVKAVPISVSEDKYAVPGNVQ